jgi:hypothetical protein
MSNGLRVPRAMSPVELLRSGNEALRRRATEDSNAWIVVGGLIKLRSRCVEVHSAGSSGQCRK